MDVSERELQLRAAAELFSHDEYSNPFGTGPSARAEPIRRYHETFPDLQVDVEDLIVADDTVVLRFSYRASTLADTWDGPQPDVR